MWRRSAILATMVVAVGCGDDAADRGGGPAAEEQAAGDARAVDVENARWFREGGVVEFNGRTWMLAGEPVWDVPVEQVGEYEGTPLFAEAGVAAPYPALYVPLRDDSWQRLEPASPPDVTGDIEGLPHGQPGIDPTGDPTGTSPGDPADAGAGGAGG